MMVTRGNTPQNFNTVIWHTVNNKQMAANITTIFQGHKVSKQSFEDLFLVLNTLP